MKTLVVNMFAGPGAGKSTTAASVFSLLKLHGINCELITEFAKDLTWEYRYKTLENQNYIMAKQHHRMWRLKEQVDVIITDSPLIFSLVYSRSDIADCIVQSILYYAKDGFDNINYFIERVKEYNPKGRNQTEDDAIVLDKEIKRMLNKYGIEYNEVEGNYIGANCISNDIIHRFGKKPKIFLDKQKDD